MGGDGGPQLGEAKHRRVLIPTADHRFRRPGAHVLRARIVGKALAEIDGLMLAGEPGHGLKDARADLVEDRIHRRRRSSRFQRRNLRRMGGPWGQAPGRSARLGRMRRAIRSRDLVQLRSPISAYGLTPTCVAAGYFVSHCASGRRDGVATLFERPRLLCRTGQRSVLQAEGTRACGTPKRKGSGAGTPGRPGVFFRGEEDWLRGHATGLICCSLPG